MYRFGTKMANPVVISAIWAGAMIFYAVEGGSLLAALIIAALITCGTLLVSWWLLKKTGLSRQLWKHGG
jgi:uncharacterized membrane protein